MNQFMFFVTFSLIARAATVAVGKDIERTEPKPGIWRVTQWFLDGRKVDPETPYKWHFERSNNILAYQVHATGDELAEWYYFTMNSHATPKEINLIPRVVPPRDARPLSDAQLRGDGALKGIYRLTGDTLELCYSTDSDLPRPTTFERRTSEKNRVRLSLQWVHKLNESDFLPDDSKGK